MYKIIGTGSKGNSIIYHDSIVVDIGVPFKKIEPHLKQINLILLTHQHLDHINVSTIKKIQLYRPTVRIGACKWMLKYLKGVKNIDLYELDKVYQYGQFTISPFHATHNVPNCGYRINFNGHRTIHVTDVAHLDGVIAKDYDLYAIEFNYDADTMDSHIADAKARGEFTHLMESSGNHLSMQQATEFIHANKKESSKILRLHESSSFM